jgi:hypothetical protein
MIPRTDSRVYRALLFVGAATVALASSVSAQEGVDFLLKEPRVSLSLRAGYSVPRAESELFDFTREQLTLEKEDLSGGVFQGEFAVRASDRIEVALGFGWASSTTRSEFRDWVGSDDLPIEQTTRFARMPLTLGVKAYLLERGRTLGRFAWVPTRWAPYVGAGAGAVWYGFEQEGEFVDFETLNVFADHFLSQGWAPTAHALAGVDLMVRPRVALSAEGKYAWGNTGLSRDFVDFDDIDLSGFQATVGFSFRF